MVTTPKKFIREEESYIAILMALSDKTSAFRKATLLYGADVHSLPILLSFIMKAPFAAFTSRDKSGPLILSFEGDCPSDLKLGAVTISRDINSTRVDDIFNIKREA
jgi:hypothetical protein